MFPLVSGILTSFFGWAGGRGDDYWKAHPKWPRWLLQSWVRDWLIGPVCAIAAWIYGIHDPLWLAFFVVLTGGALSTYWDFLFKEDNFYIHGFFVGLAAFPLAIVTGNWIGFGIRTMILCLWMGIWSALIDDADLEEAGRYFPIGLTMFMI